MHNNISSSKFQHVIVDHHSPPMFGEYALTPQESSTQQEAGSEDNNMHTPDVCCSEMWMWQWTRVDCLT